MNLIIVRHAQTGHNKEERFQGKAGKLSKEGKAQAQKLAKRLLKEKIDVVYCSDFPRTRYTLKPYLQLNKIPVNYTKDLREMSVGIFSKKTLDYFWIWRKTEKGKKWYARFKTKMDEKMPRGESYNELKKRVVKILDQIIKKEKGKNVLIMTHGKTKIMMLMYLLSKDYEKEGRKYFIDNTGVSIIHIKNNGNHKARLINNTRHLGHY